jgi:hypothetical protein
MKTNLTNKFIAQNAGKSISGLQISMFWGSMLPVMH